MNNILDNYVNNIIDLIKDPENPLKPIEAIQKIFKDNVKDDFDIQKAILSKLAEKQEFKGIEEELTELYPWDSILSNTAKIKNYIRSYDPSKGYVCSVFATSKFDEGKLIFDRKTMNFIGARTSRGKTTAMVSMAVDALLQGHKVLFSTFEETDVQIYTRIALNLAWKQILENKENNKEFDDDDANFRSRIELTSFSPAKIFQSIIRSGKPEYNPFAAKNDEYAVKDLELLTEILKDADKEAEQFLQNRQLMIYEGYLFDLQTYLEMLSHIKQGTVVFADYIQKIPTPMTGNNVNRYAGIKQMLSDLYAVVKKRDLISINGAQFGRTDNKTNSKMKDGFTDESFQESSDIEQIGEIEIGIGRDPGFTASEEKSKSKGKGKNKEVILPEQSGNNKPKPRMFFSVLKNRNGENDPSLEFDLVDGRKFSYYATKKPIEPHY